MLVVIFLPGGLVEGANRIVKRFLRRDTGESETPKTPAE